MHPHLKESRDGHSAKVRKLSGAHGTEMLPSGNEPPMQNVANGPPEGPLPQGTRTLPVTTAVTAKPRNNLGKLGFARGGRAKKHGTNVNVIVAPSGGPGAGAGAAAVPPALPLPRPPMAPPGPPMAPGGGPPGAGGPPMMPPGMGPRKNGGRTFASGGRAHPDAALDRAEIKRMVKPAALQRKDGGTVLAPLQRKDGGRTYHAGADSGPGRLEKVKAYGKKAHMKAKAV